MPYIYSSYYIKTCSFKSKKWSFVLRVRALNYLNAMADNKEVGGEIRQLSVIRIPFTSLYTWRLFTIEDDPLYDGL